MSAQNANNNPSPHHLSHLDNSDSATSASSSPQPGYAHPYMTGMASQNFTYPAPPTQHQQPVEPYRASPTASTNPTTISTSSSLNNVLPPIRALGQQQQSSQQQQPSQQSSQQQQAQQQQQQQQQRQQQPQPQAQMGSPLAPPNMQYHGTPSSYYAAQAHMGVTSSPHNPLGYQIPRDGKMMSGGRHKKEIKRRTKTGCMTCRKRRIKCDEGKPACNNCAKSKRECAGYDPIFIKSQQAGPTAIQPAPDSESPLGSSSSANQFSQHGYSNTASYAPALSAGNSSPDSSYENFSAIDPALAGGETSQLSMASQFEGNGSTGTAQPVSVSWIKIDPIRMHDVLSDDKLFPPASLRHPASKIKKELTKDQLDEIQLVYTSQYAQGLDDFFTTTWYSKCGAQQLISDIKASQQFAIFLELTATGRPDDPVVQAQETRVVWDLIKLCQSVKEGGSSSDDMEANRVAKRVTVLEALISGQTIKPGVIQFAPEESDRGSSYGRCLYFWNWLCQYLTITAETTAALQEIEYIFRTMKLLLDMQENRDILYSIAYIRHHDYRLGFVQESEDLPLARDHLTKLANGGGVTLVTVRLCDLAKKAFAYLSNQRRNQERNSASAIKPPKSTV